MREDKQRRKENGKIEEKKTENNYLSLKKHQNYPSHHPYRHSLTPVQLATRKLQQQYRKKTEKQKTARQGIAI